MQAFKRLFGEAPQSPGCIAYDNAMRISDGLIEKMERISQSKDVVPAMMADIWLQRHNIPYMTTVYQSVSEMKSATTDQMPERNPDGDPA